MTITANGNSNSNNNTKYINQYSLGSYVHEMSFCGRIVLCIL